MDKEIIISVGMHLKNTQTNSEYRILDINQGYVIWCLMNVQRLDISYMPIKTINKQIRDSIIVVIEDVEMIIDIEEMSDKQKESFRKYKSMVDEITTEYGPSYIELMGKKPKPTIKKYTETLSRYTIWKIIIKYLQSGCKDIALLDGRSFVDSKSITYTIKTGRPSKKGKVGKILDEKDFKIFETYLKKYLKSEVASYQNIFDDMLDERYSIDITENGVNTHKLLPPDQRPTENQFYYYCHKNSTDEQRRKAKNTARVVRNNERVHIGTVMAGVRGPSHIVEVDAQEMDISLVSEEYPDICIGRPVLYIMMDVFSQSVMTFSIALDNNSIVGLTSCFLNLVEDKEELYKKYNGREFESDNGMSMNDLWPTGIRPKTMRYDRGSEFISNDIKRIAGELDINIDYVSPATGSMKPIVENFFANINKQLKDLVEHKGLIRKTYGSKHHKESCLDINDAMRIVLNHIIYHNMHYLEKYPLSADMKRKRLMATPANLWKYGCEHLYNPMSLPSKDQTLYCILRPCKNITISKLGIKYKNMRYFNVDDDELNHIMFKQQLKEASFTARIDPRDMGHIYYLKNGRLESACLNPFDIRFQDYYGMSLKQFEELEKLDEEITINGEEYNQKARIKLRRENKAIINNAQKLSSSDTDNMRENRKNEKERISGKRSVAERFDIHPEHSQKLDGVADEGVEEKEQTKQLNETVKENNYKVQHYEKGDSKTDLQKKMQNNSMQMFEEDDE